jgi:predicted DCC family thiol-disulfide oxidoreductase YuxK
MAEAADADGIILFDGDCGFCRGVVRLLVSFCESKGLLLCSIRSATGAKVARELGERPEETFAFLSRAGRAIGVDAYVAILSLRPRTRVLARLLRGMPRPLSEAAYRWVADHRSQLSALRLRAGTCPVLSRRLVD